jgi:hypothetical protein
MRTKIIIMGLICLFWVSCSMTPSKNLTPEETAYLDEAMATPLIFKVPKEKSEEVWGRIQSFIEKFSSMKIQTVSDYLIETYNPKITNIDYGYKAVKTLVGEEVEFSVNCVCGNRLMGKQVQKNVHILALYALTGRINRRFIDSIP